MLKMNSLIIFTTILATALAYYPGIYDHEVPGSYPVWYLPQEIEDHQRFRRDVTLERKVGDGKVFGTLGGNDAGLYGKGGYEGNIFNDHRGKLDGQVYGSRVLSPMGDSSHFGGGLNYKTPNAAASLDLSRQIHGGTTLNAQGGGVWQLGKNADLSAMGSYSQTFGRSRPDLGGNAVFRYKW